jgi:hypothetical protein
MTITIPVLSLVLLVVALNSILEHLFNWAFRSREFDGFEEVILLVYLLKWAVVVGLLAVFLV